VNGSIAFGTSLTSGVGVTTQDCSFELGGNRGGDGNAYIDLHATSGTDYEMRILRGGGANGALDIVNNGTGIFTLNATGAAAMRFCTSNAERARISAAGGFSVGTTADPGAGAIYATGNITAYYSDEQLKTRLGNIDNALDILSEIDAFYYEANETAQALGYEAVREVGVSAQSVQRVLPEVVAPAPIDNKYLTVRYERLVPVLIEAIKELTARVAELEGK